MSNQADRFKKHYKTSIINQQVNKEHDIEIDDISHMNDEELNYYLYEQNCAFDDIE